MRTLLGVGLCLLGLYGCGGSGERLVPTQPRDVEPVITSPDSHIYIGQTVTFAANGANLRWGSDAPRVASVDPASGQATGIGSGRASIWAENAAGRTTRLIRSLPYFAGDWRGSYEVVGCQSSGGWADAGFCSADWEFGFLPGYVFEISFDLNQVADRITGGAFRLGDGMPTGRFEPASVAESGLLSLAVQAVPGRGYRVEMENMEFVSVTAGTITGTFDQVWSWGDRTGDGRLICRLRSVVRTSAVRY